MSRPRYCLCSHALAVHFEGRCQVCHCQQFEEDADYISGREESTKITLDREQAHNETIREAGAIPIGERSGLVWFTDPITKSSHVLEPEYVTHFEVARKLAQSRIRFGYAGYVSQLYQTSKASHDPVRS